MITDTMVQLSSKWWTFLVRGVIALALAGFCFAAPAATAAALVYVFAAYFIIGGIAAFFGGFSLTGLGSWWALVIMGVMEVFLGILMLTEPGAGPLALAYIFALWMVMTGALEISSAMAARAFITNEFWWMLLGIITIALGFYVVWNPNIGIFGLVYTVGIYGLLAGISLVVLAFRVKGLGSDVARARVSTS